VPSSLISLAAWFIELTHTLGQLRSPLEAIGLNV
jgi:hypothetical protein